MTLPKWSDSPWALWIKERLDALEKSKGWLDAQVAAKRGISEKSASRRVNKWTAGQDVPSPGYRDLLVSILGGTPPTASEVDAYEGHGLRLAALEEGHEQFRLRLEEVGQARLETIAEIRARLRRSVGKL